MDGGWDEQSEQRETVHMRNQGRATEPQLGGVGVGGYVIRRAGDAAAALGEGTTEGPGGGWGRFQGCVLELPWCSSRVSHCWGGVKLVELEG